MLSWVVVVDFDIAICVFDAVGAVAVLCVDIKFVSSFMSHCVLCIFVCE